MPPRAPKPDSRLRITAKSAIFYHKTALLGQRLFQPFSAGNARTGSGLGLAICREIVAALGGEIELSNHTGPEPATGLDATVRLPLADG